MTELFSTEEVEALLEDTGGVPVQQGGRTTWGHFDHTPVGFGDEGGVVGSRPTLVIAAGALPDICLDDGTGQTRGVGERIAVGDYDWYVADIEPGESPGEIRLMLSNRESSG